MRLVKLNLGCAIASLLVGCGPLALPIGGQPAPGPSGPLSFERVELAEDERSVRVDFIGGPEFDPDNPCSIRYEATSKIVDGELEIGIYAQPHPMPLPSDWGCDAMGYSRSLTIELAEPFSGTVVRDLAAQTFFLEPPGGLAEIGALPEGWGLRREGSVLGSRTPRWEQVWSPDPDPWPAEGDSMLTLFQGFWGPVETTGGDPLPPRLINGQQADYYFHAPSGEMVLVWSLGEDELALVGNTKDFSEAEFVDLAESVTIPNR